MKTFETTRLRDIAEDLTSRAMLAAMATLCIRFFTAYMAASVWIYMIALTTIFFTHSNAQKRIVNRIIHQRKFALFPGYAKQSC